MGYNLKKYPSNLLFTFGEYDSAKTVFIDTDGIEQDPSSDVYFSREELAQGTLETIEENLGEMLDIETRGRLLEELTSYYDGRLICGGPVLYEAEKDRLRVAYWEKDGLKKAVDYVGETLIEIVEFYESSQSWNSIKQFSDSKNAFVDMVSFVEKEIGDDTEVKFLDEEVAKYYYDEFLVQNLSVEDGTEFLQAGIDLAKIEDSYGEKFTENVSTELRAGAYAYSLYKSIEAGGEATNQFIVSARDRLYRFDYEPYDQRDMLNTKIDSWSNKVKRLAERLHEPSIEKLPNMDKSKFLDAYYDEIVNLISEKMHCDISVAKKWFKNPEVSNQELAQTAVALLNEADPTVAYHLTKDGKVYEDVGNRMSEEFNKLEEKTNRRER